MIHSRRFKCLMMILKNIKFIIIKWKLYFLSLDNNGSCVGKNYLNSHEIKFNKYLMMEEFSEQYFSFALMTFEQIRIIIIIMKYKLRYMQ